MTNKKKLTSVIVLAAGNGSRMNSSKKKQFIELNNKPILYYSLSFFSQCDFIDDIVLVTGEDDIDFCKREIIELYGLKKIKAVLKGGKERQQSVFNGLREVSKETDIVLVHDAARPFIKTLDFGKLINGAVENGSATFGVQLKDTVKIKDDDMYLVKTLDRRYITAIQTPQAFKYDLLVKAHKRAEKDGYLGTDDTVLLERNGIRTKLIEGNYFNIKITTYEDLIFAQAIDKII